LGPDVPDDLRVCALTASINWYVLSLIDYDGNGVDLPGAGCLAEVA
jgi:hypothetical protein